MKKLALLITAFLFFAVMITGCSKKAPDLSEVTVIKIGVFEPMTGVKKSSLSLQITKAIR